MRDDQEQAARRGLLDQLEQRIGAVGVEIVGAVDQHHAPAALARRLFENMQGASNVVHGDARAVFLGLLVPFPPQQRQIAKGQGRNFLRRGMVGVDRQRNSLLNRRRGRIGISGEKARHAPGQRRLANALGPADDPRLRQALRTEGVEQLRFGPLMAKKVERIAGMRGRRKGVALRRTFGRRFQASGFHAHFLSPSTSTTPFASKKKRSQTQAQMASATISGGWVASTTRQRLGSAAAISRNFSLSPR